MHFSYNQMKWVAQLCVDVRWISANSLAGIAMHTLEQNKDIQQLQMIRWMHLTLFVTLKIRRHREWKNPERLCCFKINTPIFSIRSLFAAKREQPENEKSSEKNFYYFLFHLFSSHRQTQISFPIQNGAQKKWWRRRSKGHEWKCCVCVWINGNKKIAKGK